MSIIPYKEMKDALRDAGFSGIQIAVMMAIALAESGGDSANVGDGGQSFGLWQIYQPVWGDQFPVNCAVNTKCAAKAAWEISNHGKNFKPWTVFRAAVEPETLDPSLRANKFTNYLPDVLRYLGIPVDVDWRSELIKLGHGWFDKVGDVADDIDIGGIIASLPEWAKSTADMLTPDIITECGLPGNILDPIQQGEWMICVAKNAAAAVPDPFAALLPDIGDVKNAVVVLAVLGIAGALIVIGLHGLASKSETYRQLESTAMQKAQQTAQAAMMAA